MQWQLIAVSVITSIITTQASLQLFPRILGDWWMERIKKNYNKELEEFRDKLQQQQKTIQSLTDKALYVTRAQFDTEFTAIKEVSQIGRITTKNWKSLETNSSNSRRQFSLSPTRPCM